MWVPLKDMLYQMEEFGVLGLGFGCSVANAFDLHWSLWIFSVLAGDNA